MNCNKLSAAFAGLLASAVLAAPASAADAVVHMNKVSDAGVGEPIGKIRLIDSRDYGLLIVPDLQGLEPGVHGFHVHENPDCSSSKKDGKVVPAGAAGGHYDPKNTGKHEGPLGNGHLGDLPTLLVGPDGNANMAIFAPRLQVPDVVGRAIVIHEGGDNYSDEPRPLGGGGTRVACGVVGVDEL